VGKRLEYIDAIRGLAAISVFIYHWMATLDIHLEFIDIGRVGVVIFFIVSGFVIPWSLNDKSTSSVREFVIKRFFRLYPAYWFSLLFVIVAYLTIPNIDWSKGGGQEINSISQVIVNLSMIQRALGFSNVIGAYWTLFIELAFYVCCVLLFIKGGLHNIKTLTILTIVLSLIALAGAGLRFYAGIKLPIILPISLSFMFYGSILRHYLLGEKKGQNFQPIILFLFIFTILFFTLKFNYQDGWFKWYLTNFISFSLCILLLTKYKIKNTILLYFGKISYSFYLLHGVIIAVLFSQFNTLVETWFGWLLVSILSLAVTTLISHFSYRFIEYEVGLISKRFIKKQVKHEK